MPKTSRSDITVNVLFSAPSQLRLASVARKVSGNTRLKSQPNKMIPITSQTDMRFRYQISQLNAVIGECMNSANGLSQAGWCL